MTERKTVMIQRIIYLVAILLVLLIVSIKSYRLGESIYDDIPGTAQNPKTITVEVKEGAGINSVARLLKKNHIIDSRLTLIIQKKLFKYKLVPGEYELNSNMTGKDILDVLSGIKGQTRNES